MSPLFFFFFFFFFFFSSRVSCRLPCPAMLGLSLICPLLSAFFVSRLTREGDLEQLRAADPNARDMAGRKSTPLHFAAGFGRVDLVVHLLAAGADTEASSKGERREMKNEEEEQG